MNEGNCLAAMTLAACGGVDSSIAMSGSPGVDNGTADGPARIVSISTVAAEMERREMALPLLIGGATTSRVHTAVKIEPQYEHGVIYVADASRAVGVASTLLSEEQKPAFLAEIREIIEVYKAPPGEIGQLKLMLSRISEKQQDLRQKRRDLEDTLEELSRAEEACVERLAELGVTT